MINIFKRLLVSCMVLTLSVAGLNAAMTKDFYAASSVLSSGKWVKIGIKETGVYEISYQKLTEMGFSDPSKVSVYGRGGRVLPESFVTNAGVVIFEDDLSPVKILHEDGKIYFYGLGPEEITFEASSNYDTGGYFRRKSNNIYSFRGYYFLTDSRPVTPMTTKNYETSGSIKADRGVGYVYHELDSVQNSTGSGQLFWGEALGHPGLFRRNWDVEMPDAVKGNGVMHCEIYLQERDYGDATISYGFENTDLYCSVPYKPKGALYYTAHEPTVSAVEVPGNKGSVFVDFSGAYDMGQFSNLDFWVVSYPRTIPSLKDTKGNYLDQQLIALPSIAKNTTARVEVENPASLVALEVSTVTNPLRLNISQLGAKGYLGVRNDGKTPVLVIFDKSRPQKQISGYEKDYAIIENQNLHSYKDEGADLIIITTPAFKKYAEEIADIHRKGDGIKVIVATTEQCYNEFSGGTPDPMAYRSFAKMLYYSATKPKNVLLLGPLFADFRGIKREHDPLEGIIAYQSPTISIARGAHNINDFYGMMGDNFRSDYYERNDVQLGVGILPVKFESEAKTMVEKIRNHVNRTDHAYYLNRFLGIGGIGDSHTHDLQVRDISNHIETLDYNSTIYSKLAIDTYGNKEAHKRFFNYINEGKSMISYFGHGAEQFIGQDRYFFNAGDVYKLRNKVLPLFLFGGCQLTNSDRGFRGLGESIVTDTPYGAIGSIVSARDTWSGQNYEFFRQFYTHFFKEGFTPSSTHRTEPVTIGEVYAGVKTYSTYTNELAYQLLCDPALVIPTVNRTVEAQADMAGGATLIPGEKFKMKGSILYPDGKRDNSFNGEIVVRINEPQRDVPLGSIQSGEDANGAYYTYTDEQLAMMSAKVTNGEFEIEVHVPSSVTTFKDQKSLVFFSAYDPSTRVGAGSCFSVPVGALPSTTSEGKDKTPPVIENLSFDSNESAINFTVSDNLALNFSNNPLNKGLYLYIDGKERSEAHFIEPLMEPGRMAYSKIVPVEGLAYGEHSARIKVKDAAGNYTDKEIVFTYNPNAAKYSLLRSELSGPESTIVEIDGIQFPASASLVVLAASGSEVWRGEFNGNSIEWNHRDAAGTKVAPGHYKAYLIETGSGTLKGHSEPIDIPVI